MAIAADPEEIIENVGKYPYLLILSSLSHTLEKPDTLILYVGVAGNFGLCGENSGFLGSFSDGTTIDSSIFCSEGER